MLTLAGPDRDTVVEYKQSEKLSFPTTLALRSQQSCSQPDDEYEVVSLDANARLSGLLTSPIKHDNPSVPDLAVIPPIDSWIPSANNLLITSGLSLQQRSQ